MKSRSLSASSMLIAAACLYLAPARAANAHAFLDHASPRVGSEVAKAPTEIRLWFTQHLEPAFSSFEVTDESGKRIDKKDVHVDSDDRAILVGSVGALHAGIYKVTWHVVSVDTHRTQGSFHFTVKAGG